MKTFIYFDRIDLFIVKGASFKINFYVVNKDDEAFDLTGWGIRFKSRTIEKTIGNGIVVDVNTSKGMVSFYPSESSTIVDGDFWILEIYNEINKYPFAYGKFRIEQQY